MTDRWKRALLAGLLCLALAFSATTLARADFGDYSGDSDYGGSDSSYDSSSDSGYSSGDSGYSSYSYSSGGSYSGDSDGGSLGFWALAVAIVLAVVLVQTLRSRGKNMNRNRPVAPGAQRTADSRLRPLAEYSALDGAFDGAALSEKLSNLYVQMQNAWTARDIEPVRPWFTDALWSQMDRQVQFLREKGRTNYVERIAVLGVDLRGFFQADGDDHLIAELRTRIVDYTLDDKTGKLVSGDQRREKFMTYEWELVRPTGTATRAEGEMTVINCPNCGAPVSMNQSAKCPYCGSVIELQAHDWALSAIRGIAQRTGN